MQYYLPESKIFTPEIQPSVPWSEKQTTLLIWERQGRKKLRFFLKTLPLPEEYKKGIKHIHEENHGKFHGKYKYGDDIMRLSFTIIPKKQ